jgi:hypothetical protein
MFKLMAPILAVTLTLVFSGCFFQNTCSDSLEGLHDGNVVQTTIVRQLPALPPNNLRPPTCGNLGDLNPGTVVRSSVAFSEGGDGCYDRSDLTPQSVSFGTLTPNEGDAGATTPGAMTLQLANGCRGQWEIGFQPESTNGSFLDDNTNTANPSWEFYRSFAVQGDASLCFPGIAAPATCEDSFIATNVIVQ